ncbi:MAG: translation initiation factor IF-2 subunit alpha [Thermoprotei archaeon]|nr:MAG: translation initiation factor IF-2 subunit alpha [Thermoprotei archaeon]
MRRRRLPRPYELVIGTVRKIEEHGAFVTLDEYGGIEAYVPLNEVSHSWFRSIREVIKVGQKRVFKVIRVDPRRGHVDVSLKRVSEGERRAKMQEWKRYQRAMKLLELAAERLGRDFGEALEEGWKLEDAYGEIFAGFEAAVREGREALEKAGVREPWLSTFYELAKAYVRIPRIKVSGVFTISCLQGDGAERLRRILSSWTRVRDKYPEVKARFYVVGPPKYKLDVEAYDPKLAERFMGEVAKLLLSRAREEGCSADFERLEE